MIEISVFAYIFTIVVFIGLIGYLNRRLYQPMLNFMDARDAAIQKDEKLANQNLADVGSEALEIENILSKARDEAAKIREAGLSGIESENSKKIEEKTTSLENDLASYLQDLSKQKDEIKKALEKQIPDFKAGIKEKLARI
ncbi:F0F1 ATP synthase subunit B' [Campylobacter ureolyticus]|uniref:F0F1 ATP synthase subunit B family protein n=1 Tax=Campylobacter ureolyticus TaxID=827 RepID=UPI0022B4D82D|nr:F0F1 ATP synthase subunit B' [Campylobacter ureolyticus]MCZ6155831.1 F0F1 ATP synthase subunit B' [Campylobacter ureolyticus]MDU7069874.1 F0F1 ATP synthase subunit B' [Campylobacter ureolyticus]